MPQVRLYANLARGSPHRLLQVSFGPRPVEDFLDGLSSPAAQKVTRILRQIEDERLVPVRFLKRLSGTEGIRECRVDHASMTYRVFAFTAPGNTLVLTHGLVAEDAAAEHSPSGGLPGRVLVTEATG